LKLMALSFRAYLGKVLGALKRFRLDARPALP
jgi:hypothetical protein